MTECSTSQTMASNIGIGLSKAMVPNTSHMLTDLAGSTQKGNSDFLRVSSQETPA